MNPSQEQLLQYRVGTANDEVATAVDERLAADPSFTARLVAAIDELPTPDALTGPFRSADSGELAPADEARIAAVRAISRANRPRRVFWPAAAALLLGALALGWQAWDQRSGDAELAAIQQQLCSIEAGRGSLPHPVSARCPDAVNSMLGTTATSAQLAELRFALEGSRHAAEVDWIATRSLLGLLRQDADAVIGLLDAHPEALLERPSLHADLALALRRSGNARRADEVLARGLALAPDDPVLQAGAHPSRR